MIFWKTWAFLKRDFQIETSYKLHFLIQLANSIVPVIMFFFVAKLVDPDTLANMGWEPGRFFEYVVIGIAFMRYFQFALSTFSTSIRNAQMNGTLEAMLGSQTSPIAIVLNSSVYSLISSGFQLFALLICSVALGFNLSAMNLPATLVICVISILAHISFGILSAASTILFKRGDPIVWYVITVGAVVGGAYFPIKALPDSLQIVSLTLPITPALEALRATMLNGAPLAEVGQQFMVLLIMAIVLFPISLLAFTWAVRYTRRKGTLAQY